MIRTATASLSAIAAFVSQSALAAPPVNAVVERGGADQLVVTWTSREPVDVYVSNMPDDPARTATRVSFEDADGRHEITGAGGPRRFIILRNTRTGELARVAERLVPLEAGSNFRDIGGYPAANGRHVRWGAIYRAGATPLLTPADVARVHDLGIVNMVDLRSDEERLLAPTRIDGIPYTAVGYSMRQLSIAGGMEGVYRGFPVTMAPHLKQIFAKLLRSEQPIAYNCSAGQDRTGFATAMVLSALGTPREAIIADYHLSTEFRRPQFEMPRIDPAAHPGNPAAALFARYQDDPVASKPQPLKTVDGKPYLDFALAEIEARWGSVDAYLRDDIGLGAADIAKLRAIYTY